MGVVRQIVPEGTKEGDILVGTQIGLTGRENLLNEKGISYDKA